LVQEQLPEEFDLAAFGGNGGELGDLRLRVPHPASQVKRLVVHGHEGVNVQPLRLFFRHQAVGEPFPERLPEGKEFFAQPEGPGPGPPRRRTGPSPETAPPGGGPPRSANSRNPPTQHPPCPPAAPPRRQKGQGRRRLGVSCL